MYFFHFSLLPHWGLMINHHGFNKSRPAMSFIPPTTIIGAISYPLNRLLGKAECFQDLSGAEEYRKIFKSINIKMPIFSPYHDLSKVLFMHRGEAEFDAVAVGKLYKSSSNPIEVIILIDEGNSKKTLGEKWKEYLRISCMSITRVGSKESIVTPISIKEGVPRAIDDKIVRTKFSFISNVAKKISGSYIAGNIFDWRSVAIGPYTGAEMVGYIVPTSIDGVEVELLENFRAYVCGEEVVLV